MTVLRGRVVTRGGVLDDGVVEVDGDVIRSVRPARDDEAAPPTDDVLLPGLVDLHCHGGGGASFTAADPGQVAAAAAHHRGTGTTTLVGSAVTDEPERMLAVVATLADAVDAGDLDAVHVEGPFLAATRCGAQDPRWLRDPDLDLAERLLDAGRGHVRVMTVAPELPGAADLAALLDDRGVIAAVGHTDADAATTRAFLARRATGLVTHLFNGMPAVHHRSPGPAWGALRAAADGTAVVEVIADGVHVADETVAGVFGLVGGEGVVLVTDAMAAAGMADGTYSLGPQEVVVEQGVASLADGSSIAGGTARLLDVVRRQVVAGLDAADVVASASTRPAAVLGLGERIGALRPGLRADVVVVDREWASPRVMRAGRWLP